MKICDYDCLNCKYGDCVNDAQPTKEETKLLNEFHPQAMPLGKLKKAQQCYEKRYAKRNDSNRKESYARYNHSDKGKARKKRYEEKKLKAVSV